jgi:hypothetical protein
MALKKLNQFLTFDWSKFSQGKTFMCTGISEWVDYDTKNHNGTKVEAVITKDSTAYNQKEGEMVNNLYEKITFKVRKDMKISPNSIIEPVNAVGKIYGEYRNQLSVTCDDIQVVQGRA